MENGARSRAMTNRKLTISIFRYNPNDPVNKPAMVDYQVEESERMTLFMALNKIREEQDPSLVFDFVCRAAICGSCAMLINGEPSLACKTLTKGMPDRITLVPLPFFKLVGDLSVDTGTWFRGLNERTQAWIHTDKKFDPTDGEDIMKNKTAQEIYEAERCVECGCCIGGCATIKMNNQFIGAAGINRVARFMVDPRDERTDGQFFEIVGNEQGTFGCIGLMACDDYCPMSIPLQNQLAYVRRNMAIAGIKG